MGNSYAGRDLLNHIYFVSLFERKLISKIGIARCSLSPQRRLQRSAGKQCMEENEIRRMKCHCAALSDV
jgi:hypothetical protein